MRTFYFGVILFAFWLLLSGHFEPLLLGLGLVSVLLTMFLAKRMSVRESYPFYLSSRFPTFLVYILREVVNANIDMVKRIMKSGGKSISPQLVEIPVPQKTDLGRVIYANTITLTPGTLSVDLTKEKVIVHALTREAAYALSSGRIAKLIPDQADDK